MCIGQKNIIMLQKQKWMLQIVKPSTGDYNTYKQQLQEDKAVKDAYLLKMSMRQSNSPNIIFAS